MGWEGLGLMVGLGWVRPGSADSAGIGPNGHSWGGLS